MRVRYRKVEHPRSVWNRLRLNDYILPDGTVLERHGKTISASQSRGLDFYDSRAPCEQSVDRGHSKRSSGLRSDADETIRKSTVENRSETFLDHGSVKSQDRELVVEANPRFPLTADMLTSRTVVKLVDPHEVAARIHHESVRCDTFARPEAARDRGGPALRDREQEVEDPLAGNQGDRRHQSLLHGTRSSDGPRLDQFYLLSAVEAGDDLVDFERPVADLRDLPATEGRRDHDPVLDVLRLLDGPDDVPGPDGLPDLHLRHELPRLLAGEPGRLHAPEDEVPHRLLEDGERALDPVVDAPEEAGAELDNERGARVRDGLAGLHAARVLVPLDDRLVALDLDDLPQELLLAHELDVVHPRAEPRGGDDGPGDPIDLAECLAARCCRPLHRHSVTLPFDVTCTGRPRSPA